MNTGVVRLRGQLRRSRSSGGPQRAHPPCSRSRDHPVRAAADAATSAERDRDSSTQPVRAQRGVSTGRWSPVSIAHPPVVAPPRSGLQQSDYMERSIQRGVRAVRLYGTIHCERGVYMERSIVEGVGRVASHGTIHSAPGGEIGITWNDPLWRGVHQGRSHGTIHCERVDYMERSIVRGVSSGGRRQLHPIEHGATVCDGNCEQFEALKRRLERSHNPTRALTAL